VQYRLQLNSSGLKWLIGDKPVVSGLVSAFDVDGPGSQDFLFGTLTLTWPGNLGDLVKESAIFFDTDGHFSYDFVSAIDKERNGKVLAEVLPDSGATAAIDNGAGLVQGATSIDIDTVVGTIPSKGWALIQLEVCAYTLSGSTLTLERGIFQTSDVAHADDTVIKFAQNKQACIPQTYEYEVRNKKYL